MKPHGLPYWRYSSKTQSIGTSEVRQQEGFAAYLSRSGLERSPHEYIDRGESGFHGHHRSHQFGDLLKDIKAKKFPAGSVVWFEDMDRFSRQKVYQVLGDWETITSNGYKIHIDSLGQTFDSESTEMEKIAAIVKAISAHDDSMKKSIRTKRNRKKIRDTGLTKHGKAPASCPFWISVDEAGRYVLNQWADLVRKMFELSASGVGAGEIETQLGNPTRTLHHIREEIGEDGEKKMVKIPWEAKIHVLGVLRNRAAIGEYHPQERASRNERKATGEVKENHYPPVVSRSLFHQVQSGLDSRRKQRGRKGRYVTNLFQELFFGNDGKPMVIKGTVSGKKYLRRFTPGEHRSWDYSQIEFQLLRWLDDLELNARAHSPLMDLEAEKATVEGHLAETTKLLESSPSAAGFKVLASYEARLASLTERIEVERQRVPEATSLSQAHDILAALNKAKGDGLLELRTRLRMLIRRLVKRIDVYIREEKGRRYCRLAVHLHRGDIQTLDFTGGRGWYVAAGCGKKPFKAVGVKVG